MKNTFLLCLIFLTVLSTGNIGNVSAVYPAKSSEMSPQAIQRSARKYAYEFLLKIRKGYIWPGMTPQGKGRAGIRLTKIEIRRANVDGGPDQEIIVRAHYSNVHLEKALLLCEAEKVYRDFVWIFKPAQGALRLQYSEEPGSLNGWKIRDFTGDGRADILMDVCPHMAFPAYGLIYCVHGKYVTILVTPYARTPDGVGYATLDVQKPTADGYKNMVLSATTYNKSQVICSYEMLKDLYQSRVKTLDFPKMASCLEVRPESLR